MNMLLQEKSSNNSTSRNNKENITTNSIKKSVVVNNIENITNCDTCDKDNTTSTKKLVSRANHKNALQLIPQQNHAVHATSAQGTKSNDKIKKFIHAN